MIVDFEGRRWDLDLSHVRLQQAMTIQMYTGMSIGEWEDSIAVQEEGGKLVNPPPEWLKSIAALYWLMRAQNGVTEPIADVDFDFPAFLAAFMEGMAAEVTRRRAEAAAKPDPTVLSPSPAAPVSPAPSSLPPTTPQPPVPPEGAPATAFTPPVTSPG